MKINTRLMTIHENLMKKLKTMKNLGERLVPKKLRSLQATRVALCNCNARNVLHNDVFAITLC